MQFFMSLQTAQNEDGAKEEVIFDILLLLLFFVFLFCCFFSFVISFFGVTRLFNHKK